MAETEQIFTDGSLSQLHIIPFVNYNTCTTNTNVSITAEEQDHVHLTLVTMYQRKKQYATNSPIMTYTRRDS